MLNNIETPNLKINITAATKEIKISTKLYKHSTCLGIGDFVIPIVTIKKREEFLKKWLNVSNNLGNSNKKTNITMNLINSIRLYLKAVFNYSEMKSQDNSTVDVSKLNNNNNLYSPLRNSSKNSSSNFRNVLETFKKDPSTRETESIKTSNMAANRMNTQSSNTNTPTAKRKLNNRDKNHSCTNINIANMTSPISSNVKAKFQPNSKNEFKLEKSETERINLVREDMGLKQEVGKNKQKVGNYKENRNRDIPTDTLANTKRNFEFEKTHIENKKPDANKISDDRNCEIPVEEDCMSLDNSFIDPLFSEDPDAMTDNNINDLMSNKLNNCVDEFKSYYDDGFLNVLPEESSYLKFEVKMLIEKAFEIQENYHQELNQLLKDNRSLKKFLLLYNEKYRYVFKKLKRLQEQVESNRIKKTLNSFVNSQSMIRLKDNIDLILKEINVCKVLLKMEFKEGEVKEFTKNQKLIYQNDKNKLFGIADKIIANETNKEKFSDGQKMILNKIMNRYREEKFKKEEEKGEEKSEKAEKKSPNKNNNSKNNETIPDIDDRLRETLTEIQSKKNIPSLSFKKLVDGIYEFDGHKIILEMDNKGHIRVNSGNKFQLIEDFIDSTLKFKMQRKDTSNIRNKHFRNNSTGFGGVTQTKDPLSSKRNVKPQKV